MTDNVVSFIDVVEGDGTGRDAREALLKGINLADATIGATLGPRGKLVLIDLGPDVSPHLTKDGATVAKHLRPRDASTRLGVDLIKQATKRVAASAGDGTTTCTVVAAELCRQVGRLISAGHATKEIVDDLDMLHRFVTANVPGMVLNDLSKSTLMSVAMTSSNGDAELAEAIVESVLHAGQHGPIEVSETSHDTVIVDKLVGCPLPGGMASPYFKNSGSGDGASFKANDCNVLVIEGKLSEPKHVVPHLERSIQTNEPLLIIAEAIEAEVMQLLVTNRTRLNIKVCAMIAHGEGRDRLSWLEDVRAITGAERVGKVGIPLEKATPMNSWGKLKSVISTMTRTMMVVDPSNMTKLDVHKLDVSNNASDPTLDAIEKGRLSQRLIRLSSGAATLRVPTVGGGDISRAERIDRLEDALLAVRSAMVSGVLAGAGATYVRLANKVKTTKSITTEAVARALEAPAARMCKAIDVNFVTLRDDLCSQEKMGSWSPVDGTLIDDVTINGVPLDSAAGTLEALNEAFAVAKTYAQTQALLISSQSVVQDERR